MMKLNRTVPCLSAIAASVVATSQTYTATELSTGGYAMGVALGVAGGQFASHAVQWGPGGMVDLHPSGYTYSAINDMVGTLSVGYVGAGTSGQIPAIWRGSASSILDVPFAYIGGRAVATDGVQVVGSASEGDPERGVGALHAILWDLGAGTSVDLGKNAYVYGVGGGQQAGAVLGSKGTTAGLWRGTRNTYTDLHVRGFDVSVCYDTDGATQVGYLGVDIRVRNEARPRDIRFYSAVAWNGSSASVTFLPSSYRHSFATAITGDTIVGYGNTTDAIGTPRDSHAVAWVGPNHDYVDLHALLPADMRTSRAIGVDESGNIVGYGVTTGNVLKSFIWRRQ